MPTLAEILDDKKGFPDDRKVTLADGVETTLGELRGGYMKDADYRQKTSKLAREREELQSERQRFDTDKQEAEAQLAKLVEQAVTRGAPRDQQQMEWESYIEQNPLAKRLMTEVTETRSSIKKLDEMVNGLTEGLKNQQQQMLIDQHKRALAAIKSRDPELDEQALVNYCRENAIPRLDLGYRLFTEDKRIKTKVDEVKEAAAKEGYEKAKRELAQPMLPHRRVAPSVPENAPKTLDEAFDRAASDPEILATMEGLSP